MVYVITLADYPTFRQVSIHGQRWLYLATPPADMRAPCNIELRCQNFRQHRTVRQIVYGPTQGLPVGAALLIFGGG